jgi:hypothetical protein
MSDSLASGLADVENTESEDNGVSIDDVMKIIRDSGVRTYRRGVLATLGSLKLWHFVKSRPLVEKKAPENEITEASAQDITVKQIVTAKVNREYCGYIIPFIIILAALTALFWTAESLVMAKHTPSVLQLVCMGVFALVAVGLGMYEVRVKMVDDVIAQYKESYPKAAAVMNRDPWVVANRSKAVIAKYISIITIFMAALLAIK